MSEAEFHTRHLLVVAFEGWNDAGEAASTAARTLRDSVDAVPLLVIDGEEYFDYQFNRPMIARPDSGAGIIAWPSAVFSGAEDALRRRARDRFDAPKLSFLIGIEPARAWRSFTAEVLEFAEQLGVTGVVVVGAMLADVPHTRPIAVYTSSDNDALRAELGIERSSYEGPVGIVSVLAAAAEQAGLPTVSLWASVPHYVHTPPSPKATLALLERLETLLQQPIPHGALEAEAGEWERSVDAMAGEDEEMAGYITTLEQARDAADSPDATGDAIAQEFERYLRGADGEGGDKGGRP